MRNFAICLMLLVVIGTASVRAQDATWAGGTADDPQWHATANWTPAIVPTGTATFGSSGARFPITFTDSGGIGIDTSIDTMHFLANAPSYIFQIGSTFTPQELKITGLGVVNDAAARPMFFVTGGGGPAGMLTFAGSSTAANSSISIVNQASVIFSNSSSAGSSEIRPDFRTKLVFRDSSSAQNSTISGDGFIYFLNNSTAGKALINASSFNKLSFLDNSTAGNSTIYGNVTFGMHSTGSSARYIGVEDIVCSSTLSVGVTSPGMTIGSIEGVGRVLLGNKRLSVGTNNLSTTYAGTISGDANSSLQKVGASTLSLTGVNTYTGATLVDSGQLNIDGSISSSALTTINAGGILSGNGMVGDTVVSGGRLAPGNAVATLNVNGSLTFSAASSYLIEVSPTQASQVNVSGTATLGGAIVRATFDPSSYVAKHYTIVTATGGVNGTFGNDVAPNFYPG
ncbi:MAG: autotransporter-associated beta strand repeat-containing protein [Xanthobacteraceae bacterium]